MKKYLSAVVLLFSLFGCSSMRVPDISGTKKYPDGSVSFIDSVGEYKGQEIFLYTDQMPRYGDDPDAFLQFVASNIHYPSQAKENEIEGRVAVAFYVTEIGEVKNVQLFKGIDSECDNEAMRVMKLSKPWIPGKHQGKNVVVKVLVPIVFKLRHLSR